MSSFINGRRIFAAIVLALTAIAVHESFFDEPQLANTSIKREDSVLAAKFRGSDAATTSFRSDSKLLSRIYIKNAADRTKAAEVGTIVEDYRTFVIVSKNKAVEAKQYGLEEQEMETTVNLPGASFDPVKQAPEGTLRLGPAATGEGKGYYVIQFGATVTDEWLKAVRDAGVEVIQYVPNQAFFVYADSEAIARVADHSRVRWIGRYNPNQKLSPVLRGQLETARKGTTLARGSSPISFTKKNTAMFDIAVFARADINEFAGDLQNNLAKGPLRITKLQNNFFNSVRVQLSLDDVEAVAAMPDVFGIDAAMPAKPEDERSNQILAGNYLNSTTLSGSGYDPLTQFGADGTNVTVSVVDDGIGIPGDGGFYISSLNAVNGPLRGALSGSGGHGHFNATIIAGSTPYGSLDNLFFNYAMGVAPRAHIVSIPRNRIGYTGTNADVYNDSVTTPGPNGAGALISNNSWGEGTNGNSYGPMESEFDSYVFDASFDSGVDPIALVFSAGNDPINGLTRPKAAKNVIAVGNSESLRTELGGPTANNIDDVADNSSRGLAADGRIKPDIVAPGTAITGGRSGSDALSGNIDSSHRWSSGTSHSAASITGVAALFANRWYATNFGQRPTPSLIKAALINSAQDLTGGNASAPIPNGTEGWGRPNIKFMLNTGVGMQYINQQVPLQTVGDGFHLVGSVADSSKPLRITVVWTDPAGASNPALVNNLDLTVVVGGVTYKGNVFSNGVSVPGGTADNRNNVENVFLPAGIPIGTSLDILVSATSLNGDGIINNGDATDQNYSLVVYNWSGLIAPQLYSMAGRVISSSSGRGIGMAKVRITSTQGISREIQTNQLGYFRFDNLASGNYTIDVTSKRYSFVQRVEPLNGNLTNLTITSSNQGP